MLSAIFLYLLKGTLYLSLFALAYRWLLSRFTHFHWMRFYLIVAVLLSIILPFIQAPLPALLPKSVIAPENGFLPFQWNFLQTQPDNPSAGTAVAAQPFNWVQTVGVVLLSVYVLGLLYKMVAISKNLFSIRRFVTSNPVIKENRYNLVSLSRNLPAFSFWRYIFLSPQCRQLPASELRQIKQHELVHIQQHHTLDLLFFELAGAVFWFNPLMNYLKKALRGVHEFLADAAVAGKGDTQKTYAHLLLKLSAIPQAVPLANGFSDKQIGQRIMMLTKTRSLPRQKFVFLLMLPLTALLMLLGSCLDKPESNDMVNGNATTVQPTGTKIGNIIWNGNVVYDDDKLNEILTLKAGDSYDKQELEKRINNSIYGEDISSLYMDQGYLFFNVETEEQWVSPDAVDLVLNVFEGTKVKVGKIIVKGNQTVSTDKILEQIPFKSGDWFNRSKLIEAQQIIAFMGNFDPKQVGINPYPDATAQAGEDGGTVDIEFTVVETNTK